MSEPENFIDKHFGAIITAVVSLSAVLVSVAQIWVATINKEKKLAVARTTAEEARDFEELACFSGYDLSVGVIPLIRSNKRAPKGTVEIWLPGKAIHGNTVEEQC